MRVIFARDFDWPVPPRGRSLIAYKAGRTYTVPRACGTAALAAGAAELVPSALAPLETAETEGESDDRSR